jgi:hypothetical protein
MSENRISSHFGGMNQKGPAPLASLPADSSDGLPGLHMVRRGDIYQVARARAQFEHELSKLFNPDATAE